MREDRTFPVVLPENVEFQHICPLGLHVAFLLGQFRWQRTGVRLRWTGGGLWCRSPLLGLTQSREDEKLLLSSKSKPETQSSPPPPHQPIVQRNKWSMLWRKSNRVELPCFCMDGCRNGGVGRARRIRVELFGTKIGQKCRRTFLRRAQKQPYY